MLRAAGVHERYITGNLARQLHAAGLTEISEDEMQDCAETLAPFIPLLEKLRSQVSFY